MYRNPQNEHLNIQSSCVLVLITSIKTCIGVVYVFLFTIIRRDSYSALFFLVLLLCMLKLLLFSHFLKYSCLLSIVLLFVFILVCTGLTFLRCLSYPMKAYHKYQLRAHNSLNTAMNLRMWPHRACQKCSRSKWNGRVSYTRGRRTCIHAPFGLSHGSRRCLFAAETRSPDTVI